MGFRLGVSSVLLATAVAMPAAAQDRLVHQETDRNTRAIIRVFKTATGGRVELQTPQIKVTKAVAGNRVVTTLTDSTEQLVITTTDKTMVVASGEASVSAARSDRQKLEGARLLIARSSIARRAAELLGKLGLGAATPAHPMLLTTRAFLLAAAGDPGGSRELSRWAREARLLQSRRTAVLKVGYQDIGSHISPTGCWEAYSKEAIAAYMEYEDCMKGLSWYDFLSELSCATIYDMRAIGAFSWWLKCVALN
jgi:hypothetical protein